MNASVIIPAYKARRFLPDCLDSIGRQTLLPREILVIDDASPEPVDDIVADFASQPGYPPIRLIRHDVNRGQAAGRNTGIRASSSEWLAFIDCDDVWAPNHLEQAKATLQATGADLAFCPATIFKDDINESPKFIERAMTPQEKEIEPMALFQRCFIIMSSVVANKSSITSVGGFDESESMRSVEDFDFFMRLLRRGAKFANCPESTLYYRKHPEAATAQLGYMAFQSARVRQHHASLVKGSFFRKRSIVSYRWWLAWLDYLDAGQIRLDVLCRALCTGCFAPQQILRGAIRTCRRALRHGIPHTNEGENK